MFQEFKKFLIQGNMVDMAIGFIFGGAFSTVIKSLVDNVIMPPVGMLLGKVNFSQLYFSLNGEFDTLDAATKAGAPIIKYGQFINDIISFVILGFVVFMFIKGYNKLKAPVEEAAPAAPEEDIVLLREIRDSLAKK